MSWEIAIVMLPGLVIGLSLHEFAHAWSASLLGDDFARRQGRVSLNPFRHLSILGTLALFVLGFGWGKPVQINLYNFKHPKRDYLISSLAGPLANVIVVFICFCLSQLTRHDYSYGANAQLFVTTLHYFLIVTALINTILATINLLPIPPLDGSKIWPCLIPGLKPSFGGKATWIFIIGIILLMRGGYLSPIINVVMNSTAYYMPEPDSEQCERLLDRAKLTEKAEKFDQTEKILTQALQLNPKDDHTLYLRAATRWNLDNMRGAIEDIDRAIALGGDLPEYLELRADILGEPDSQPKAPASQPVSQPADIP